ncbi:hypothetical protein ACFV6F_22590 [Kitasatospora phosalacinea]
MDEGFVVPATADGLPGDIRLGLRVRVASADDAGRAFVVRAGG